MKNKNKVFEDILEDGQTEETLDEVLKVLVSAGLVETTMINGEEAFRITEFGRQYCEETMDIGDLLRDGASIPKNLN